MESRHSSWYTSPVAADQAHRGSATASHQVVHFRVQARMVLKDPSSTDRIIDDWQSVLPATLKQWNLEQKDLQIFFEDFRNELLKNKEVHQRLYTMHELFEPLQKGNL